MSETYSPSSLEGSPDGGGNQPYTRNAKVFGGAAGNQTSQQNDMMAFTQGGESEYLQGISQAQQSPSIKQSPNRRSPPSKFQILQHNIQIKAHKFEDQGLISEFEPSSPGNYQNPVQLHMIDLNKSTLFQNTPGYIQYQLRQLPVFSGTSHSKSKSNHSKFRKLPIDTKLVDATLIKGTLSVKKDNQGNESGFWNHQYPQKNPPNNNNRDLTYFTNSIKEIIDEPNMHAAKDNEKQKTYISLKKSEIQMPNFSENIRPSFPGVQTGGPLNPQLKQQMMAMRRKFNDRQNQLTVLKDGKKSLTPSHQVLISQTPNLNFDYVSNNRNNQLQLEDNFSTQGIQLRIKNANNANQKKLQSPKDQRQKVHITMVGENFLDKSPSEEPKSDEDIKSLDENMLDSQPHIQVTKSPKTLINPVSPKITISPKEQQILLDEAFQQVKVSANLSKSMISQQQRRISTPSHYHNHVFYKAQRSMNQTALSGQQPPINLSLISPNEFHQEPQNEYRCMTAFGKQIGTLRLKKNTRGSEGGNERIHDESIRANGNNTVVNTIELNEVKHGEITLNQSILEMPIEVPLQRGQLQGSKRTTPQRLRGQKLAKYKETHYALSPVQFTTDLKNQLRLLKSSQTQLQSPMQQSYNNDIIPVLSQFNHSRLLQRKTTTPNKGISQRRRQIQNNLGMMAAPDLIESINIEQISPKSNRSTKHINRSPPNNGNLKPLLIMSNEERKTSQPESKRSNFKVQSMIFVSDNPCECASQSMVESPLMREVRSKPTTPSAFNAQGRIDQMRKSHARRLLNSTGKQLSRPSNIDININSKQNNQIHHQQIKEILNQTQMPSRHQHNQSDLHASSIFLSAFLESEQQKIMQPTVINIMRTGTRIRTPGMLFNQNRGSMLQVNNSNGKSLRMTQLNNSQTPMLLTNPSIKPKREPNLNFSMNLLSKQVAPRQQRHLMSPVSLLNDYALVKNERSIFKELKGDKLLQNIAQAANNHMYTSVLQANREIYQQQNAMQDEDEQEHVVTE